MLKSKNKWNICPEDVNEDLPVLERLLASRGIYSEEEQHRFLHPELKDLTPPDRLANIDRACSRIIQAVEAEELILVYGDYDADGITSTSLLMHTLLELGANCEFFIPNRFKDGYGLNEEVIRSLPDKHVGLVITVDTGIANVKEAAVLKELGIDLIITDHHEVQEELPDAYAIIHPKLSEDYSFKELAGVGVAFQIAHYLFEEIPAHLLAFAAIGTVADLVPLQGDNRILVYYGLKALNANDMPGMEALKRAAGFDANKYITERDIGFMIGPRLNAAGRISNASIAVDMLLTTDEAEAASIAEKIEQLNVERQNIVKEIVKKAEQMVNPDDLVIMLYDENWHEGVLGIAASRLVKRFDRPVIMLTYKNETNELKGSARSIPAFHMFKSGMACKELFTQFGGHAQAAGMTFPFENFNAIKTAFNQAAETLQPEDFKQEINHIERISLTEATESFVEKVNQLSPFGMANEEPVFLVEGVPSKARQIGQQNKHLKLQLKQEDYTIDVIGFNLGDFYHFITPADTIKAVGKLQINEWNGNTTVQIVLEDMAIDEWQLFDYRSKNQDKYFIPYIEHFDRQIFLGDQLAHVQEIVPKDENIKCLSYDSDPGLFFKTDILYICDLPRELSLLKRILAATQPEAVHISYDAVEDAFLQNVPSREEFKWVYGYLLRHAPIELKTELPKIMRMKGWRKEKPIFILKVFFDLEFIHVKDNIVRLHETKTKRALSESATYQKRLEQSEIEQLLYYSTYDVLKDWFITQLTKRNIEASREEMVHGL